MKEIDIIDFPSETTIDEIVMTETLNLLGDITEIKEKFNESWESQYEKDYISNLQKSIVAVQSSLIKLTDNFKKESKGE